jgi:hypothetical protein
MGQRNKKIRTSSSRWSVNNDPRIRMASEAENDTKKDNAQATIKARARIAEILRKTS